MDEPIIMMNGNSGGMDESTEFELTESSISAYDFEATICENQTVKYQVLKMNNSVLIWIGTTTAPKFSDLSLAMKGLDDSLPVTSKIMGSLTDTLSDNLASRLTKKLKKPVFLSFNIPADRHVLRDIEKRLLEEVESHPQMF